MSGMHLFGSAPMCLMPDPVSPLRYAPDLLPAMTESLAIHFKQKPASTQSA